jgi:hypothetical protein
MTLFAVKADGTVDRIDCSVPFDHNKYIAIIAGDEVIRENKGAKRILSTDTEVRADFADHSTGNKCGQYYNSLACAFDAFNDTLIDYGYHFSPEDLVSWEGNEGRKQVTILDGHRNVAGIAQFFYYRMESGRWEVIAYIT